MPNQKGVVSPRNPKNTKKNVGASSVSVFVRKVSEALHTNYAPKQRSSIRNDANPIHYR